MKLACKLVALDMDGALLTSAKNVLPETLEDLRFARDAEVSRACCTGRGLTELRPYLPPAAHAALRHLQQRQRGIRLPGRPPAIVSGHSRSPLTGNSGGGRPLSLHAPVSHGNRIHRRPPGRDPHGGFHMGVHQSMYLEVTRQVDDMIAEGTRLGDISKIDLYFPDQATRLQAHAALKNLPISLALTEQTGLEMMARSVTKASGLQHLAKLPGLSRAETAAVGDGENDREMLIWAGFFAAMGNALPEIQALCDCIVPDNDHNGVGTALRRAIFLT